MQKEDMSARTVPIGESSPVDNSNPWRAALNMTQKTMAKRMLQSARDIPRVSVSMDLNAGRLAAVGSRVNSEIQEQDKKKHVSVTALLIRESGESV